MAGSVESSSILADALTGDRTGFETRRFDC
jgi:hypothetical protein